MKNLFTLIIALLLPLAMQAQPSQADPVAPASKGALPEMPLIEQAKEGRFSGLSLSHINLSPFQGVNWWYDSYLNFPAPETLGGEKYLLQKKVGIEDWYTMQSNGENIELTGSSYIIYGTGFSCRLVLKGGDKDGWISNEVAIPYISIPSQIKSYTSRIPYNTFVGSMIAGSSLTIYAYHDIYDLRDYDSYKDDPSFVHTWYRRNPNTGEMISTGNHNVNYTITAEDVGFEIVEVVTGDKNKTDFYYSCSAGIAKFPINCSAEFFYEGFIVNCEYDIPEPQTFFGIKVFNEESNAWEVKTFDKETFKVVAPGRYAITYPWENYCFGEEVHSTISHFGLSEQHESYSEQFRLWASPGGLETKAMQNGQVVEGAKIHQLEKNMSGHMQYVCTCANDYLTVASFITHYAKAVNVGDGNLPTYYPNALLWTDAKEFNIMEMYHSEEGPQPILIEVRSDFAPLGGSCTIEGKINGEVPVPVALLTQSEGEAEEPTAEPVYVYLREKGGDIVAAALMQADGSYKFEKIPYGTYEVIPNIDGYTVDIQSVTLSAENSAAKVGDYTIGQYVISAGEAAGVEHINADTTDDNAFYDLSGRRMTDSKLSRGLYILNRKKVLIR